jgi:poly(3-hydroxybutyrate) depolymerase
MFRVHVLLGAVLIGSVTLTAAGKITKEKTTTGAAPRTYYLYLPEAAGDARMPLLVTLHGSGRDGRSLLPYWEKLAKTEHIIVAGPDATVRQGWGMREDGPQFLYDFVEELKQKYPVDPRRVYLFGHSAGAIHALAMAVLESEYFAAVAVHAGILDQNYSAFVDRAPRRIPIGMWVGTRDDLFPIPAVRATRDLFKAAGFEVPLTEIAGHTHWYYDRGADINKEVWAFLQDKQLSADPKYQQYEMTR